MDKILLNDKIVNRKEAKIDIEDRGYQFGDGVYEVIRIYGGKLFTADEHLDRLYSSAEKIKISFLMEKAVLHALLLELISINEIETGSIYMQITGGASPRNHIFPGAEVEPVLTAYTKTVPRPEAMLEEGADAITADDIRWLRCDIKSLNLLPNLLAKQEAAENGCYESILNRSGIVTEGSSSNVYIVKEGVIKTHPATNLILNGITRQVIAELCKENRIPFEEEAFTVDDLLAADEVFISSTTSEVMPINRVDGKPVGAGKPGDLTRKLQSLFKEKAGV